MNPSLKLEKAEIILEENHFSKFPLFLKKKKSHGKDNDRVDPKRIWTHRIYFNSISPGVISGRGQEDVSHTQRNVVGKLLTGLPVA